MYAPSIPATIQAEDFDSNGYFDTTQGNEGGAYRTDVDVDIKHIAGGYAVGWMATGEWLEYTLYVAQAGEYDVTIRSGTTDSARKLKISQCDTVLVESFTPPKVNTWGEFKTWSAGKIKLSAGYQKIRISVEAGFFDLDWIHIGPYAGTLDPADPVAPTGVPGNYPLGNAPVKSTGCGTDGRTSLLAGGSSVSNGAPTSTRLTITSNNALREYIIDIPTNYDNNKPYRLFYTSHWINSNATAIATGQVSPGGGYANWSFYGLRRMALAANDPAIFVAPSSSGGTWQQTDNTNLFSDILNAVSNRLCIDTSRVFATGFSFGGMITYSLSTNKQKQIRAAVGIGPANFNIWLPNPLPSDPIAWMSVTGMGDTLTPWDGGNNRGAKYIAEHRARDNGCAAAAIPTWNAASPARHICYDYTGCKSNYPVKACTFNGGHIAAPIDTGGGDNGLTSWVPTESWNFFSQF